MLLFTSFFYILLRDCYQEATCINQEKLVINITKMQLKSERVMSLDQKNRACLKSVIKLQLLNMLELCIYKSLNLLWIFIREKKYRWL
jgi:hypothetical protein